jgi:hypothetical protein
MKINDIHKELIELAKNLGISVRKEKGNFRSGYCTINEQEIIILNRSTTIETMATVLAQGLSKHSDKVFIKPVIREFIEKEKNVDENNSFSLEVKY